MRFAWVDGVGGLMFIVSVGSPSGWTRFVGGEDDKGWYTSSSPRVFADQDEADSVAKQYRTSLSLPAALGVEVRVIPLAAPEELALARDVVVAVEALLLYRDHHDMCATRPSPGDDPQESLPCTCHLRALREKLAAYRALVPSV